MSNDHSTAGVSAKRERLTHHLDRRADNIAAQGVGDPNDLLTSTEIAEWFSCSIQWVEIGRHRGWGPPFCKLGDRKVRYRRGDVLAWLAERTHRSTAEYAARRAPADAAE